MSEPIILVTGATGTIGSQVVKHLAEAGHGVHALVRDPAKVASLSRSAEFVVADLLKPETLEGAFKMDNPATGALHDQHAISVHLAWDQGIGCARIASHVLPA